MRAWRRECAEDGAPKAGMSVVSQIATAHGGSAAWMPFGLRTGPRAPTLFSPAAARKRHDGLTGRVVNARSRGAAERRPTALGNTSKAAPNEVPPVLFEARGAGSRADDGTAYRTGPLNHPPTHVADKRGPRGTINRSVCQRFGQEPRQLRTNKHHSRIPHPIRQPPTRLSQ